jgi:hypothetical protein
MSYDLDEKQAPLVALYLGGNPDLYVLHDPCTETVRFVPVGSSRVEHADRVTCRPPQSFPLENHLRGQAAQVSGAALATAGLARPAVTKQ